MSENNCGSTNLYILTIYKIIVNENSPIHIVSHIKQHKRSNFYNEKYLLLKDKRQISEILCKYKESLYNDILSKYRAFKKCPITEICRHICESVDSAKSISEKMRKIPNEYNSYKYNCYKCGVSTNFESHWIKHQLSRTHIERITFSENELFTCEKCEKCFLSRSCLWRHNKTCFEMINQQGINVEYHTIIDDDILTLNENKPREMVSITTEEIMKELTNIIKDQHAFQEKMIEVYKQPSITNNTNSHNTKNTNSHNTTTNNHFNLNFFLNETCKNAITIKEFIENIHVGIDTVEYAGHHGYVEGISKIITDELKKLGYEMRPIHCTDLKRETIYIKDVNGWEKDNEEKEKLSKTINSVARKNMNEINHWRTENPKCELSNSKEYNFEIDIMKGCMGDFSSEKTDNKRICNRIAKCAHTPTRGKTSNMLSMSKDDDDDEDDDVES